MRIAQIAPLAESVPPTAYGGTERVVSYLTEQLVAMGHDVTLFASGDSRTAAKLVPCWRGALRVTSPGDDLAGLAANTRMIEWVRQQERDFDIVHYHVDFTHFPLVRRSPVPHLTTLHGRLDSPALVPLYREFDDVPLVSISDAQRLPLAWANWVGTVLHGLPHDLYALNPQPRGDYLAFIGRTSPEKGIDRAIEVAQQAGVELHIAAKVDAKDREYFDHILRPLIGASHVKFVGEINEQQKQDFLGNARALLFQIDWPEPFGLAMIEAMACGTPVIARRRGSVPEVVDEGVTGFIVETTDEAVAAVHEAHSLDRTRIRTTFQKRFSVERMAADYVRLYESLARLHQARVEAPAAM